jgi:hypothetical protein
MTTTTAQPSLTEPPATRSLYRLLLMKGLLPAEAANLTAFMCGLPATGQYWSLREVNQMLFLREMNRTGRFGNADRRSKPPH